MVDLADRRVLGDQLAFLAAQVADVAAEHDRSDPRTAVASAAGPGPSGAPRRIPARFGAPYDPTAPTAPSRPPGPVPAGSRSAVSVGQVLIDQVADQAEPAVGAEGVRAGVLHVRQRGRARMKPSPTRGLSARSVASLGIGKAPDCDHPGQFRTPMSRYACSNAARCSDAELAGVLLDHRDHPVAERDRDGMGLHREMPACRLRLTGLRRSRRLKGLGDQVLGRVRDQVADDVVEQRGRPGGRPDLGRCPEDVRVVVGHPQHQVGEAEIGEQLPLRDQQLEPGWSVSERSVCSEMISDIDGMSQIYRADCSTRFARSARIAPGNLPTSSSLGDEKHVPSLLLSTAGPRSGADCSTRFARSARIAPGNLPTSSSLGDEKHVPSLLLSTAGPRSGADCSTRFARSARILWQNRRLFTSGGSNGQECPQAPRAPEEEREPRQAPQRLRADSPSDTKTPRISVGFLFAEVHRVLRITVI